MILTWDPNYWKTCATQPDAFLAALRRIKGPSSRLSHTTYLECIHNAFLNLSPEYHEQFFSILLDKCPHPDATRTKTDYFRNKNEYLRSDSAPVTLRAWVQSVAKLWDPNKKERVCDWILHFNWPDNQYSPIYWDNVVFDKGPSWLRTFVYSRRASASTKDKEAWHTTLKKLPLATALDVVVSSAQNEILNNLNVSYEMSPWVLSSLSECLDRMKCADYGLSSDPKTSKLDANLVLDLTCLAISNPDPQHDHYLSELIAGPSGTTNVLPHFFKNWLWRGSFIYKDSHITLANWFSRQNSDTQGQILSNLCANKNFVESTTSLDVQTTFLDFIDRTKLVFSLDNQKSFLRFYPRPTDYAIREQLLSRIFPLWSTAQSLSTEPILWLVDNLPKLPLNIDTIDLPDMNI